MSYCQRDRKAWKYALLAQLTAHDVTYDLFGGKDKRPVDRYILAARNIVNRLLTIRRRITSNHWRQERLRFAGKEGVNNCPSRPVIDGHVASNHHVELTPSRGGLAVAAHNPIDEPMMSASNGVFQPGTDFEREEVRKQLRKMLASRVFHHSKRYAAVLKYIVDQTLEGAGDQLKERTIGIDVFHRTPDYDTAADHAVRSAVAEVRKRLAQYYQQDADGQLRIEVLPGSYVPQFRWTEERPSPQAVPFDADPNPRRPIAHRQERSVSRVWSRLRWIAAACLILIASGAAVMVVLRQREPFENFWKPVMTSRGPVLLCVGNLAGGRGSPVAGSDPVPTITLGDFHRLDSETVHIYDAVTLAKFAGLMQARGKQFRLVSQSDATFDDLQHGPAVLVGLLNNDWTERLLPNLRFTIQNPTSSKVVIHDLKNPSNQDWSVDFATPYLNVTRDYALVLRIADPETEHTVVMVAGITVFGTFAAGDFLTSKDEMRKLAAIAPPGWEKKNMEIVLSTDVIRGQSGPATIVAAQFW